MCTDVHFGLGLRILWRRGRGSERGGDPGAIVRATAFDKRRFGGGALAGRTVVVLPSSQGAHDEQKPQSARVIATGAEGFRVFPAVPRLGGMSMSKDATDMTISATIAPAYAPATSGGAGSGASPDARAAPAAAARALWLSFSLIIVTKGRPEPLRAALRSVVRALPPNAEVIVVDGDPDRSAAAPVAELRRAHPDVSARYLATDPGMTLQRNRGIDAARGNVVVCIDDDCTVEPDLFEALARVYEDSSVIGATGLILEPANPRLASSGRLRRVVLGGGQQGTMNRFGFRRPLVDLDRGHAMEFMYGTLMSARREFAATVRFDEGLGAYALGEDDDFSYRLSRRGRLRYEPTAVVHHHELGRRGMNQRKLHRIHVVNKTYLFHKNFAVTRRARVCFAVLLAMLFVHRMLNREWSGLLGLAEGIKEVHGSRRRRP